MNKWRDDDGKMKSWSEVEQKFEIVGIRLIQGLIKWYYNHMTWRYSLKTMLFEAINLCWRWIDWLIDEGMGPLYILQVNSVVADGEVHTRPQDLCNLTLTTYILDRNLEVVSCTRLTTGLVTSTSCTYNITFIVHALNWSLIVKNNCMISHSGLS